MSLILCGYFCAGKTTLGKLCAERLQLPFYDTDQLMEACYGKPNTQIWKEYGQKHFRHLETEVILGLGIENAVIATGGGSMLCEKNRAYLKKLGISVYLKASVEGLYQRMLKRGFPVYLDASRPYAHFKEIADVRFPIYESHCEYIVDTESAEKEKVIEMIIDCYGK